MLESASRCSNAGSPSGNSSSNAGSGALVVGKTRITYSIKTSNAIRKPRIVVDEDGVQVTVPAGDVTTGVVYDYLRLELKED